MSNYGHNTLGVGERISLAYHSHAKGLGAHIKAFDFSM